MVMVKKILAVILVLELGLTLGCTEKELSKGSSVSIAIREDKGLETYKKSILTFLKEELANFGYQMAEIPFDKEEIFETQPRAVLFNRAVENKVDYLAVARLKDEGIKKEISLEVRIISVQNNESLAYFQKRLSIESSEAMFGALCRLVREELGPKSNAEEK